LSHTQRRGLTRVVRHSDEPHKKKLLGQRRQGGMRCWRRPGIPRKSERKGASRNGVTKRKTHTQGREEETCIGGSVELKKTGGQARK